MKKLLLLLLILPLLSSATTYYVSATGGTGAGTSTGTAWSISKFRTEVNAGSINPGDFILFKRGDVFTSATEFTGSGKSGSAGNTITLSAYGTGAKPRWEVATSKGAFSIIGISYWVFDNLNFQDLTFDNTDKVNTAPMNCGIRLGDFSSGGVQSNNNIIQYCDVDNCGLGYVINGNNNIVQFCNITDLKNVVNTNDGGVGDYGANGITIAGDDNYITDCLFTGNWCASYDFGLSGGAIEFFGACNRNQFLRNRFYDCGAIGEFGADDHATTSEHNRIAFCLIINCGSLSYVNFSGSFATTVTNTEYYNNVIVENSYSRFSGTTSCTGFSAFCTAWHNNTSSTGETAMLAFGNGSPSDTIYDIRNNIFVLANNQKVASSGTVAGKTTHLNNVYKFSGGSSAGFTLGVSEVSTSAALFLSESGDPTTWDYHLTSTSPARGVAVLIPALTKDFFNVSVSPPYNAGVDGSSTSTQSNTIKFPAVINGVLYNRIE